MSSEGLLLSDSSHLLLPFLPLIHSIYTFVSPHYTETDLFILKLYQAQCPCYLKTVKLLVVFDPVDLCCETLSSDILQDTLPLFFLHN